MLARKQLPLEEDTYVVDFFLFFVGNGGICELLPINLVLLWNGTFTGQFLKRKFSTSWWFQFQPNWNILVKMGIFPRDRGENKRYLKPPPRVKVANRKQGRCWVGMSRGSSKSAWKVTVMRIHAWKLPKILRCYQTDMEWRYVFLKTYRFPVS